MAKPLLIIGNKNYSSWSLRPWLALKVAGIEFDEQVVPLFGDDWATRKAELPSGTVPVLQHDCIAIWETLAILEYAAETWPNAHLWPQDKTTRAVARAAANEMHAGFAKVRSHMPMNIRGSYPGRGLHPGVAETIRRIETLWGECRARFGQGGDFLFGEFCIADAMFAPVVSRFSTYAVPLNAVCQAYRDAVQALPAMQEWSVAALAEPWIIDEDEIDFIEGRTEKA
ncbi:MAG: glutathione S-transferase family protein [Rhodospirillales bacterium]|nr:glutathione S-transferase family protein [Rhodospirillales bacterium]